MAQLTGSSEPVATTTTGEGAGGVAGFGRPGGRLGYRPGLEGLRGIAVLLVLAVHLGEFVVPSAADWLVPGGFLGVDLFFVLSGFLIGTILLTQLDQRGNILLGRFLGRRFVRLAPALALVLGAHYVYAATIHASLANERSIDIWAGLFAINWLPSVGRTVLTDMIHLWSVAIEGQFYLVIPFVLYPLHRFVRRTWAIVGVLGALVVVVAVVRWVEYRSWHDWILVYERFDARSDTFLCGVIVAVLWNRGVLHATAARVAGALGAVTIGVLAFTTHTNPPRAASPFLFEGGFTLVAVAGAAIIAATMLPGSAMERTLAVWPMRALGRISYSLYLWHLPVFAWAHEHIRSTGLAIVTALGVSLVFSTAAFYIAERPVLRNRFKASSPSPSPAPRDLGPAAAQLDVPRQR